MPNDLNELIASLKANPNRESVSVGSTVRHLRAAPPRHRATVGVSGLNTNGLRPVQPHPPERARSGPSSHRTLLIVGSRISGALARATTNSHDTFASACLVIDVSLDVS
jgi:hypothetical protein